MVAGVGPDLGEVELAVGVVSPVGPVMAEVQFGSATVTPVRVTLPTLVTTKLYGTTWPAAVMAVVVEDLATLSAAL